MADVGTNKSNILEARIWLKDIKRDFAAMNGVLFICDGISQMTPIFFCESKSAYYCKHRSGTRGWTRRARECATASRATLPERTCWSRSRLLPQFEMKYIFHILGISLHIKNNQLSENARGNLLVEIQINATIHRLSQKSSL